MCINYRKCSWNHSYKFCLLAENISSKFWRKISNVVSEQIGSPLDHIFDMNLLFISAFPSNWSLCLPSLTFKCFSLSALHLVLFYLVLGLTKHTKTMYWKQLTFFGLHINSFILLLLFGFVFFLFLRYELLSVERQYIFQIPIHSGALKFEGIDLELTEVIWIFVFLFTSRWKKGFFLQIFPPPSMNSNT